MKITRDVPYTRPRVSLTSVTTGGDSGPSGHVLTSVGSNGSTAWGSNVAIITSNGSNALTGPFVNFASGSGVSFSAASNTLTISASGGLGLPWFDVKEDYGAAGDGVTDDTAEVQAAIDAAATAGGGVVYFRAGVYLIGGALTDTSRSNSQLRLPSKDYVNSEQITIHLLGEFPPPPVFSVIGTTTLPDEQVVIKGTLTSVSGTSPSLLGGWGPDTALDFTNILVRIENLTFRLPENPVYSALNLSKVAAVDIDNVICDVSDYYIQGITEPTTAASYGIRLPELNNGAYTRLGAVNVAGYYTGIQVGEHTQGEQVSLWGCKRGLEFIAAYHASHFDRLMTVHCERGIIFTGGLHYFSIDQYNIEHADAGWWITDYDIDDASNYGVGHLWWKVTLANVGHSSVFTVNGATGIQYMELGDAIGVTDHGALTGLTDDDHSQYVLRSILTTKGDLLGRSVSAVARFAVGSNGTVPVADSGEAVGIRWSVTAGVGEILITDTPAGSPLVFADLLQNEDQTDLIYGDL